MARVSGDRCTPLALRHYYASKLIEKGKDLKFIQNAMGHSKIVGLCQSFQDDVVQGLASRDDPLRDQKALGPVRKKVD